MTLKEIEIKFQNEHKSGYVLVSLSEKIANRLCQIDYLKDIAEYFGLSYENTQVKFIKYVGWVINNENRR